MLQQWIDRLENEIWHRDLADAGRPRRLAVSGARILFHVGREVWEGQLTLRAMSLVYTTLLSLIPLLAIIFSVLKGFGVHREFEPFLITYLAPLGERADELARHLIRFIDNTNVTVLGYLGFAFLFYAITSLLQKVEQAFNYIWRVTVNRTFSERIRDYLVLVFVGPTLMFLATGIWATLLGTDIVTALADIQPFGWLLGWLTRALPFVLVILAFTFIYAFLPNARVRWRPALAGATVAGVLWNLGGFAFAYFVGSSANYPAIYSSFATAIFFMIWLYVGWMILFIGGSISFYAQNSWLTVQSRQPSTLSNRLREKLAIAVAQAIGRRFYTDAPPHTALTLSEQLSMPPYAIDTVLAALEDGEIIVRAGKEAKGFVPAHDWESISTADLLQRVREYGELPGLSAADVTEPAIAVTWGRIEEAVGAEASSLKALSLEADAG